MPRKYIFSKKELEDILKKYGSLRKASLATGISRDTLKRHCVEHEVLITRLQKPSLKNRSAESFSPFTDQELIDQLHERNYFVTKDPQKQDYSFKGNLEPFEGETYKIAVMGDTHMCSRYQQLTHLHTFYDYCEKQGIKDVYNTGDITDGNGHVYRGQEFELFVHGADRQVDYIIRNYPQRDGIITHFICLSEDTEVFTEEGWKNREELKINQKILSYSKSRLVWNEIKKIHIHNYNGKLLHIHSATQDQLVTPDHAFFYLSEEWKNQRKERYRPAKELLGMNIYPKVPVAGVLDRKDYDISDAFVKLIGLIVTEGSLRDYGVTIYQNEETSQYIRDILNNSNLKWSEYTGDTEKDKAFYIHSKDSKKVLKYLPEKLDISFCINNFSSRQLELLFESMIFGDGSIATETSGRFYTNNKRLAEQFQILCVYIGFRGKLISNENIEVFGYKNKNVYTILYNKKPISQIYTKKIEEIEYKGVVFDITTEVGNFLARRNGCVFFTGNCGNHDESHYKTSGHDIGLMLSRRRNDMNYYGFYGAKIDICGVKNLLYINHGAGGGAYARSYNLQKFVEQMAPDQKPFMLFQGHYHTMCWLPMYRNVSSWRTPCFQSQTPYLKRKGLYPEIGGLIVEFKIYDKKPTVPKVELVPFYVPKKDDY